MDNEVALKPLGTFPRKLNIYVPWAGKMGWIYKYRLENPFDFADKSGQIQYLVDTGVITGDDSGEARLAALAESDCHIYHQYYHKRVLELAMMEPRPAIILSSDDHLEMVEPFNPSFCHTGTHNLTGKKLEPGDRIMRIDVKGEHVPLWEDGKEYREMGKTALFDITRNLEQVEMLKGIARECDGVVVSTEALAEVYRGYGAKNVYVYPNSLNFEIYPKVELAQSKEVKILWTGGASHYIDLYTIKEPLGKVLRKYPHAKFLYFGQEYPIFKKWFGDSIEFIDWVDPEAYTYRLSMIGHDINLCALRPTPFAECKSAIKFYESSAIWNPAVTLGADFGPYQEIIDGETGFRYTSPKEFEWKLSELIENAPLRKQLAQNAQDWVHSYRDVRFTTGPYIDWLRSTSESVREHCSKALQSREPGMGEASPDESPNEPVRKLIVAER